MRPIDYELARQQLDAALREVENSFISGIAPAVPESIDAACRVLFASRTQAYREVLLGCIIARSQDDQVNVRLPYATMGEDAFNGRTLDERVINPFLRSSRIPTSTGPYLNVFRRSVRFDLSTRPGLRDKTGYDALLLVIEYIDRASGDELRRLLRHLLLRFIELRQASIILLSRLQRLSLDQYDTLISGLLESPSGGRFPMLIVVAMLSTIKEWFGLDWEIRWQGINVADAASGAGGDITVERAGSVVFAAEVTERRVEEQRVVTTFDTKIAPAGIEEYLFFVMPSAATLAAQQQANRYFAQGHEVNFIEIQGWIRMLLATIGARGRSRFNRALLELLDSDAMPASMKVAWNEQVARLTAGS